MQKKYNTSVSAVNRIIAKLNLPKCPLELRQKRGAKARLYWTKEKIIKKIIEYHENGEKITSSNIQKLNGSLHNRACEQFGGWAKAVEASGFDYKKINLYSWRKSWTRETIIKEILKLHLLSLHTLLPRLYSFYSFVALLSLFLSCHPFYLIESIFIFCIYN